MREKEPMSMEEYADRITEKIAIKHSPCELIWYNPFLQINFRGNSLLYDIIFAAIQLFQEMQDEKNINLKEQYQLEKLEKERQEGK